MDEKWLKVRSLGSTSVATEVFYSTTDGLVGSESNSETYDTNDEFLW
jgi:hypothetical protein